jgi:hypothetical protein
MFVTAVSKASKWVVDVLSAFLCDLFAQDDMFWGV